MKDAPVILLDEATASLDPENEGEIQKAIAKLVEGKTVIMIAHRLRTVVNADQILVLDDGRVVESGTHKELLEQGGLYRKLTSFSRKARIGVCNYVWKRQTSCIRGGLSGGHPCSP